MVMGTNQRNDLTLAAIAAVLAIGIFLLDLSLPLDVAAGVPYMALILLGWWFGKPGHIFLLGAVASALAIAGYYYSPQGGIHWVVLTNRALALVAIWVTVALLAKAKGAGDALQVAHNQMERHTEAALRESEERFRAVVSYSPAKIHIKDKEGRYLLVNRLAEELFGVTDEEAKGKTTHEIFPSATANAFKAHDQAVLETGQTIEEEEEWLQDGDLRTFLTIKFPIRDGDGNISAVGAIGTDITERKRAEAEVERQKTLFEAVFRDAPDAMVLTNAKRELIMCNPAFTHIFGYEPEEVVGWQTDFFYASREEFEKHGRLRFDLSAEEMRKPYVLKCKRRNGEVFPGEILRTRVTSQSGKIHSFIGVIRDITERERAGLALREARDQAEAANRAKSEFLAAMSHELRTPLNAIIGFSEIMENETLGPMGSVKYCEYAEDIHKSGEHLLDLINDILDLSKVESGAEELHEETIEIPEIVRSVLTLVRQRAEHDRVELKLEVAEDAPALRADKRKLKQVLVNLVTNAIKFTNPGGKVTLKAWCRPESGYVFQVIDTGIGIPAEDSPKALSQFGQVDSDLNRRYEGTGLGLPLTKGLMEMHGGSLDLQSQVGVGTTVTVRFPASRIMRLQDELHAPARMTSR
jgi:PAS domain S-box-containing protein